MCRRPERAVLATDDPPSRSEITIYLNQLSDLLFVLACYANQAVHLEDVRWNPREQS
ncbi:ATP:cob(I)alamin adenosyltransferase [Pajaroellobacter abortibovis]|uniref:ATP:cob(I)alamin adenosyltransferase n=1 Tax=Pajaroellobacter abortibovis TaxID=1882918 RepID=UPI0009F9168F